MKRKKETEKHTKIESPLCISQIPKDIWPALECSWYTQCHYIGEN